MEEVVRVEEVVQPVRQELSVRAVPVAPVLPSRNGFREADDEPASTEHFGARPRRFDPDDLENGRFAASFRTHAVSPHSRLTTVIRGEFLVPQYTHPVNG